MANNFLLESGSTTLLESGSALQLESGTAAPAFVDGRRPSRSRLHAIARMQRRGRSYSPYLYSYGLPVTDTFAGPAGGAHIADITGQHWEQINGVWTKDGAGHLQGAAAVDQRIVVETYASDLWLDTTLSSVGSGSGAGGAGLIFRFVDSLNFWRFVAGAGPPDLLFVIVRVAGAETTMFSGGSYVAGDKLSVNLAGSTLSFFQNDVLVNTLVDSTFVTATKHGLRINNGATTPWAMDSFHAYLAPFIMPGRSSRPRSYPRAAVRPRPGRSTLVVPAQVAVANPAFVSPAVQHRLARGLVGRRRPIEVVRAQVHPPFSTQHRVSGASLRRGHTVAVVPEQLPPSPVSEQRRVTRALRRRSKPVEVVPVQATVVNPAFVFSQSQRRVLRSVRRARGRTAETVPAQVVVANPAFVFSGSQRRVLRGIRRVRGRTAEVVRAQVNPPIVFATTQRRGQRGWRLVRGRTAQPIPAQVVVVNPALPGNMTLRGRVRSWFVRRRQHRAPIGLVSAVGIDFGPTPTNVSGSDGRSFVTGADGRSDITGPRGSTIVQ